VVKERYIIIFAIMLLLLGIAAAQQRIVVPVRFVLPSTTTFTLAVPGTNATTFASADVSGTTATTIIFNSTSTTIRGLNATAAGGAQQSPTVPMFNLTNTGNRNINITINFTTALPSGVSAKAGWGTNSYQVSCAAPDAGPPVNATNGQDNTRCSNVTASATLTTIANLSTSGGGSYREVWFWADYVSATVGIDDSINLRFGSLNMSV